MVAIAIMVRVVMVKVIMNLICTRSNGAAASRRLPTRFELATHGPEFREGLRRNGVKQSKPLTLARLLPEGTSQGEQKHERCEHRPNYRFEVNSLGAAKLLVV
jgi:hypothetical protein